MNEEFLKELIVSMSKRQLTFCSVHTLYHEGALVNFQKEHERDQKKQSASQVLDDRTGG